MLERKINSLSKFDYVRESKRAAIQLYSVVNSVNQDVIA